MEKNIEKFIGENFGMVHMLGFKYLIETCKLYPGNMMEIYKIVAKKYNTTASRVERAIRYYKNRIEYLGDLECMITDKFTNEEFVAAINFSVKVKGR